MRGVLSHTTAKIGLVSSLSLLTAACSVFGVRDTPEPSFRVVQRAEQAQIELREYPPTILAKTRVEGDDYKKISRVGFRRLADYIFGENVRGENIGMTAPVYQTREAGERIGMTAPVYQTRGDGGWEMAFVMPARYTLKTIPQPRDRRILLVEEPARRVAVIRFSGRLTREAYTSKARELLRWVKANGLEPAEPPQLAGYDPPFTLPWLRRNEVSVVLREAMVSAEPEVATKID